ncbi:VOC family protein [Corynebacterium nasicanis]
MRAYADIFGAEVEILPTPDGQVMHSALVRDGRTFLLGSDTFPGEEHVPGTDTPLAITGDDEAEIRGYWERLAEGAEILSPLEPAPWGALFGLLQDRFGTRWMFNIAA